MHSTWTATILNPFNIRSILQCTELQNHQTTVWSASIPSVSVSGQSFKQNIVDIGRGQQTNASQSLLYQVNSSIKPLTNINHEKSNTNLNPFCIRSIFQAEMVMPQWRDITLSQSLRNQVIPSSFRGCIESGAGHEVSIPSNSGQSFNPINIHPGGGLSNTPQSLQNQVNLFISTWSL